MSKTQQTKEVSVKSGKTVKPVSTVNTLFDALLKDANSLQSLYRSWVSNMKKLSKEMEKEKKRLIKLKPKRKVRQNPQKVSEAMQVFMKEHTPSELNITHGDSYTRQIMMKTVSSYIKKSNLQNEANKKQWTGKDKTLKKIFTLEEDWYTFMQINGLLSRVIQT